MYLYVRTNGKIRQMRQTIPSQKQLTIRAWAAFSDSAHESSSLELRTYRAVVCNRNGEWWLVRKRVSVCVVKKWEERLQKPKTRASTNPHDGALKACLHVSHLSSPPPFSSQLPTMSITWQEKHWPPPRTAPAAQMALEIHLQTLPPRLTRRIKRSHTSLLIFFAIGTAQHQQQGMKRILDHGKSRCGMQSASHFGLCNTKKVSPVWQRRTQTKNTNESTQVSHTHTHTSTKQGYTQEKHTRETNTERETREKHKKTPLKKKKESA